SPLQPNRMLAEYVDVYSPLLYTPNPPHPQVVSIATTAQAKMKLWKETSRSSKTTTSSSVHLIGRRVCKIGRSSGHTTGTVMAYALEYNYQKGISFFTDLLVVSENRQTFDLEGDSGSLIILTSQDSEKPRPIGIMWGATANRGRLKLRCDHGPQNCTSGVDLGHLLDRLELDLIITSESLKGSAFSLLSQQRRALVAVANSAAGESSIATAPPLGIKIEQLRRHDISAFEGEEASGIDVEERQFISTF
ncbi:hypothetical protein ACJX0J_024868, partial [Zea mays]